MKDTTKDKITKMDIGTVGYTQEILTTALMGNVISIFATASLAKIEITEYAKDAQE